MPRTDAPDMPRTDTPPRPPEPTGRKPIDYEELTGRCMGRFDLAERILSRFRQVAEAEMRALETAAGRADRAEVEQIAHRVAGSALNVSAGPLADRCRRLEREAAAAGDLDELVADTLRVCREAVEAIPLSRNTGGQP